MSETNKFFWVIEGDRCYWDGRGVEQHNFGDIHHAVRFADEASASVVKYWLLTAFKVGLRVTSHAWIDPRPELEKPQ